MLLLIIKFQFNYFIIINSKLENKKKEIKIRAAKKSHWLQVSGEHLGQ